MSDTLGLKTALTIAPAVCLLAAVFFMLGARHCERDRGHFVEPGDNERPASSATEPIEIPVNA